MSDCGPKDKAAAIAREFSAGSHDMHFECRMEGGRLKAGFQGEIRDVIVLAIRSLASLARRSGISYPAFAQIVVAAASEAGSDPAVYGKQK